MRCLFPLRVGAEEMPSARALKPAGISSAMSTIDIAAIATTDRRTTDCEMT